jgi:phosphoribosyl 1,2-cyclic phosphate phosphodiesterase
LLLQFDGRAVVIDTAPDFRFQAMREVVERVDALLFTHAHADHVLGLDDVRPYYFKQGQPIPLYADGPCMESLQRMFPYIFDPNFPYDGILRVEPRLLSPSDNFSLWGEIFTPLPVLHGHMPVLGFRFRQVAYVTDFSTIPEATLTLLEGLDLLILDALRARPHPTHSSLAESLAVAERLKPARALFTHIAHEMGHGDTNASLPPWARLAYDGLRVEV